MKRLIASAFCLALSLAVMCVIMLKSPYAKVLADEKPTDITKSSELVKAAAINSRLEHIVSLNTVFGDEIYSDSSLFCAAANHLKEHKKVINGKAYIETKLIKEYVKAYFGINISPESQNGLSVFPDTDSTEYKYKTVSIKSIDNGYIVISKVTAQKNGKIILTGTVETTLAEYKDSPFGYSVEYAKLY